MENNLIERIESPDLKVAIAKEILYDLPNWFGLPDSTQAYIDDSRALPFWAAKKNDNNIGFITLANTSKDTAEIHCMGVKKEYHRQGVGRLLYAAIVEECKEKGYSFLQVKTVNEGHYTEYDRTIAFYESMGFCRLEVFPALWDEWNPCLVMIRYLKD